MQALAHAYDNDAKSLSLTRVHMDLLLVGADNEVRCSVLDMVAGRQREDALQFLGRISSDMAASHAAAKDDERIREARSEESPKVVGEVAGRSSLVPSGAGRERDRRLSRIGGPPRPTTHSPPGGAERSAAERPPEERSATREFARSAAGLLRA